MAPIIGRKTNLYIAAFTANIAFSSCGCCLAWTSPTLPPLMAPESWLLVSVEQSSWVGSLIAVGGCVGPLMAGRLLDLIGRKSSLLCNMLLLLVAWAVLMAAQHVWMLYLGRLLTGVAVGLIFMAVPLYIAEITEDEDREALCALNELFLAAGFLTAYAAGSYLSYHNLIFVCIVMPVVFLLIFLWMPESPHYLLAKGKRQETIRILQWLRGGLPEDCIEKELIEIQALLDSSANQLTLRGICESRGGLRALYLTCALIFIQQFSGINAVQFYTQQIFARATEVLSPSLSCVLLGVVQAVSAVFTPPIVKYLGLKVPLIVSGAGVSVSHFMLGLYYYLDNCGYNVDSIQWLPVLSLLSFTFFFCFGFGPLPWATMGEMFPPNMKAMSSAFVTSFCFMLMFVITKFFSNFSSMLGSHSSFWLFSLLCALGTVFTYFYLPNTKGMSLQDIQDLLNDRYKTTSDPVDEKGKLYNIAPVCIEQNLENADHLHNTIHVLV
ncbi:facilitated trehalose transporter Tret1 [Nilaparvata lugens]|uniref:Sugar transporter 17 n=1 Tax=Nilaparvata lugens TaxID=108931 RepID=D4AHY2_NILLU|nr:facilitated trehalose transporter Tret1 [Nilaparvata lugens]BAI83431.1 sugar transporter 17 [Nilaparvata lugens]